MIAQSDETADLFAAMVAAQSVIRDAGKDRQNPHLKNRYATLESVLDEVRPAFNGAGLAITQHVLPMEGGNVVVATQVVHTSGQWIRSVATCPLSESKGLNTAQAFGIVVTYLRRYSAMAVAGIVGTDDDTDGDTRSTGHREEPHREARTQEPERAADSAEERPFDPSRFLRAMQALDPAWTDEALCALAKIPSLDKLSRARADAAYTKAKAGEIRPPKPTTHRQPADSGGEDDIP